MGNNKYSCIINAIVLILFVLLVAFLVVLWLSRWFCSVTLVGELVPSDVVSLLITSLVAIFLGYYITKKLTESRAEKDSLIEDLRRIESYMYAVQDILKQYNKINIQQITSELGMAALSINRFKKTLDVLGEKGINTESLESEYFKLYTVSTDFEGEVSSVESIPSGSVLKCIDLVLIEVRRLMHVVNIK